MFLVEIEFSDGDSPLSTSDLREKIFTIFKEEGVREDTVSVRGNGKNVNVRLWACDRGILKATRRVAKQIARDYIPF